MADGRSNTASSKHTSKDRSKRKREFRNAMHLLEGEEVTKGPGSKRNATGTPTPASKRPEFGQLRYGTWILLGFLSLSFTIYVTHTADLDKDYEILPEEYRPTSYSKTQVRHDHELPVSVTVTNGLWTQKRPHKRIYNTFIPLHYVFTLANPAELGPQKTLYWEGKRVAIQDQRFTVVNDDSVYDYLITKRNSSLWINYGIQEYLNMLMHTEGFRYSTDQNMLLGNIVKFLTDLYNKDRSDQLRQTHINRRVYNETKNSTEP